jgi:hypothetical protein
MPAPLLVYARIARIDAAAAEALGTLVLVLAYDRLLRARQETQLRRR